MSLRDVLSLLDFMGGGGVRAGNILASGSILVLLSVGGRSKTNENLSLVGHQYHYVLHEITYMKEGPHFYTDDGK